MSRPVHKRGHGSLSVDSSGPVEIMQIEEENTYRHSHCLETTLKYERMGAFLNCPKYLKQKEFLKSHEGNY